MSVDLKDIFQQLSMLGSTNTKTAAAQATPEDKLVNVLKELSKSFEKKAEDEGAAAEVVSEPAEETPADAAEDAASAASAILKNPDHIAQSVAKAVADVVSKEEQSPEGDEGMNADLINKISSAVATAVKQAVDSNASFGVSGNVATGNLDNGNVQDMAQKILNAQTTNKTVDDSEMVAPGGATDPMKRVAPTNFGGEQKPLQGAEVKAAVAKMSNEDAAMLFKLAGVGYDVTVATLAEELAQEKVAQAQIQDAYLNQLVENKLQEKIAQATMRQPIYPSYNYPTYLDDFKYYY